MKAIVARALESAHLKMKFRFWIISVLIVVICFLSGFLNSRISFFSSGTSLGEKQIALIDNNLAFTPVQLMWWEFDDDRLDLNFNNYAIEKQQIHLLGKEKDDAVSAIDLTNTTYIGTEFNGTFMAASEPIYADITLDGVIDKINITAKADTIFTRGFTKVNTFFEDPNLPFEVVLNGNYDLKVYFNNQLLKNAEVLITSDTGLNKKYITDGETGEIHIGSMNILREGINILYRQAGEFYLQSYVVEGHRLLSADHLLALKNLGIIFLIDIVAITLFLVVRKYINEREGGYRG